jgi:hypothetical protein
MSCSIPLSPLLAQMRGIKGTGTAASFSSTSRSSRDVLRLQGNLLWGTAMSISSHYVTSLTHVLYSSAGKITLS